LEKIGGEMEVSKFHAHVSQNQGKLTINVAEMDYVEFTVARRDLLEGEVLRWICELEEKELNQISVEFIWDSVSQPA